MIDPQDALAIILQRTRPLTIQSVPLAQAHGFCLARTVRADRDLPPTDRSAMDGYALRAEDLCGKNSTLMLVDEVAAGSKRRPRIRKGLCVRIFTGAVIPPGADAVVKVEDTREAGGIVTVLHAVKAGANIRKRGEETTKGKELLARGTLLGPAQISLCAAVGKATLPVYRYPRPAVISTGNEIVRPEDPVTSSQIRDANGPALCAALERLGCNKPLYRIAPDTVTDLRRSLRSALKHRDVVLFSGGVSMGRYDLVPQVVRDVGGCIRFHKVAIKPGKPFLYATYGRNQHIFGLPGNPLSVLNGFHEFVVPALRRLSGRDETACRHVLYLPLSETLTPRGSRQEHILAKVVPGPRGSQVTPIPFRGSADLPAATAADGVIVLPRDKRKCRSGCFVEFRSWRWEL